MTGGSSLFLNAPVFQIIDFWSATVDDLYKGINAVYTPIAYNGLGATGGPIDNKIRVNGGNYIEIYHDQMTYANGDAERFCPHDGGFQLSRQHLRLCTPETM